MKQYFGLMIFAILPILSLADSCNQVSNDLDRLSCFDAGIPCARIDKNRARLECYDQSDKADAATSQSTSSPVRVTSIPEQKPSAVKPPRKSESDFGLAKRKNVITATITEVQHDAHGIDYLRLDNGQIWKETEDTRVKFVPGQNIRIKPGIMNSFNLKLEGTTKLIKVRRTQ